MCACVYERDQRPQFESTALTKGLIPEHTEAQMQQYSTPREKATILVTTVRQKIEIAPKRFHEFVNILFTQAWTRDIAEMLRSSTGLEHIQTGTSTQVVSTDSQSAMYLKRKSISEYSSNGEEHTFSKLNSEDKAGTAYYKC